MIYDSNMCFVSSIIIGVLSLFFLVLFTVLGVKFIKAVIDWLNRH